jgi:hypothetical protein
VELWSSTLELQLCHARMCDWHATCMGMEGSASLSSCCATCTGQASGLILVVVGHTAGACIGDMIMCTNVARICVRVMACELRSGADIARAARARPVVGDARRPVLSDLRVTSVTTPPV